MVFKPEDLSLSPARITASTIACVFLVVPLLAQPDCVLAAEPTPVEIPIIGQRLPWWQWSSELLCELAWSYFDGFEVEADSDEDISDLLTTADSIGLLTIVTPVEFTVPSDLGETGRAHYGSLSASNAFIETDEDGFSIEDTFTSSEMQDHLRDSISAVTGEWSDFDAVWCWKLWDEAPSLQRDRMFDPTEPYDQYFPNMFPCSYPGDTSMVVADSASTYSWLKWILESVDTEHPTTTVFAGMPYISTWAGKEPHGAAVPSAHIRANIVRAYCGMRYQDYPFYQGSVKDNFPTMLQVDVYPFRHVGTEYQEDESYTPALGDSLNTWLLNHAESGMDSTFLAATLEGCDLHYFPQAFGAVGGEQMWKDTVISGDTLTIIYYDSYLYRVPTPAELRMLINVALTRQAEGIFPYCLMGYSEGPEGDLFTSASLFDFDMVPWDAPFEDYCYRSRAQDSLTYIRPDSIPPFESGFDPLYGGTGTAPSTSGEQGRQDFLEWKFEPYGRLWDNVAEALADVAVVAPELVSLSWWDDTGHPDAITVTCHEYCYNWAEPECRVFTDAGEDSYYLFYVNRCCRDSVHTFTVGFPTDTIMPPSQYALDHSRRFIIPEMDQDANEFSFQDTLGPGQARLVELIGSSTDVELRITEPDVFSTIQGSIVYRHEFGYTSGDVIEILAVVFNLGTDDAEDVEVVLTDLTTSTVMARDTLDFDGLSLTGHVTDSDSASFQWSTDAGDIGIHLLELDVEIVDSEDTGDNVVRVPFLIRPRDYATEVREDPWDMTEATSSPPDWNTDDIERVSGDWVPASWTDSVSGMFEGALDPTTSSPHQADISLAIPDSRADWIDADTYYLLSFAGAWYSPYMDEFDQCEMYARWKDDEGNYHGWFNLNTSAGLLTNGWNNFRVVEDIDLTEIDSSWEGLVQELWIRFQTTPPILEEEEVMSIRLGWVTLEEGRD